MARRFIDTGFFKDPFVRGLQGAYKGLYIYLFLDCSNAGIWNKELDVAKLRCGIDNSITEEQIKEAFKDKIIEVENGQKWFVINYLKVQHNGLLKRNNKAHISAIEELLKYDLIEEVEEGEFQLSEKIIKGLPRGLQDPKVMVKVKDKVMVEDKEEVKEKTKKQKFTKLDFKNVLLDLGADKTHVEDWLKVRSNKKATNTETALRKFINECNQNNFPVSDAVRLCAEKSWSGFKYEWLENSKKFSNGNSNTTPEPTVNRQTAEVIRRNSEGW